MSGASDERVVIAEIFRSRGLKGEVSARSQTDIPGRLETLKSANVRLLDGSDLAVTVESAWPHKGDWVLKFAGVDSVSEADRYAGADLWVPLSERGQLPEGEHFESDLIGCQVVHVETGKAMGVVSGLQNFGASSLLEMEYDGRVVLIPFVDAICPEVDLAGRVIKVDPPDGLLDL